MCIDNEDNISYDGYLLSNYMIPDKKKLFDSHGKGNSIDISDKMDSLVEDIPSCGNDAKLYKKTLIGGGLSKHKLN